MFDLPDLAPNEQPSVHVAMQLSQRVAWYGFALGCAQAFEAVGGLLQLGIEPAHAESGQRLLHSVDDPALLSDEALALAVRSLGIFVGECRNRHHLAVIALTRSQPRALEKPGVEPIGLCPPMLARHRHTGRVDDVGFNTVGPEPARQPDANTLLDAQVSVRSALSVIGSCGRIRPRMPMGLDPPISVFESAGVRLAFVVRRGGFSMWSTIRRVFVGIGAIMAVLVYTLQFKKACENNTPLQCLMETWRWAGQGSLTPRETASVPPTKLTTPPPIRMEVPPASKQTAVPLPPLPPGVDSNQGVVQTSREVPTPQEDRRLVVINTGTDILDNFYASNCRAKNWGRDRLGEHSLSAGQRKMFDLEDGSGECCFDLRVKFRGGEQRTNMAVDICKVAEWSVSNQ